MGKELIKELNIVFKKNKWKLLPENNEYSSFDKLEIGRWFKVIFDNVLYIERTYIPYEKYVTNFTIKQLDNFVVEVTKDICLKYGLREIVFGGNDYNLIKIKENFINY